MGSNQFQSEYIEYLQERNNELMGRLNHMKENYENKILSKDLKKHYLLSTLEDVLNICTEVPQEIDLFFDKMTAAMGVLKNILLRKSEMVQLVEKISKVINSTEHYGADLMAVDDPSLLKEPLSKTRSTKKTGTVKVSPMINGHVISTEPRIYLSRVPEVFTPKARFETQQLSPIIEASPDVSSDLSKPSRNSFRDITVPVERLNVNKMSFSYMSEESPKSRFKGPKTWKKSLTSTKHQKENSRNQVFLENKENLNKRIEIEGVENVDPLEGPSWLYNENEGSTSLSCFMDYRRRKHRFATVFDKSGEYISSCEGEVLKLSKKEDENSNNKDDSSDDDDDEDDGGDNGREFGHLQKNRNEKKKDFQEFKNIINETSEDLFCESYVTDSDENISPSFKKRSSLSRRKGIKDDDGGDSGDKNNTESEKNITLQISTSEAPNRKKSTSIPEQLDVSNKSDNESREIKRSKKSRKSCKKHRSQSICEGTYLGVSIKKASSKSECGNKKGVISVTGTDDAEAEKMNSLIRDALKKDVFVKLEDCMLNKEIVTQELRTRSPSEKKSLSENTLKSKSISPGKALENEGRKKRKAAPTFKLVEPQLKTKLRRN